MAAGLVYHNIVTKVGVDFTIAGYVPDTSAPDVGLFPVSIPVSFTGLSLFGQPTDAKNTATDTTSVAVIPLLKQISASVQAPPSQVMTNVPLTNLGAGEYETVAASQTAQVLGATGGTGDYISGILVIPATVNPGVVTLLDNATSIPVFVGGTASVSNLVPFFIPLGIISVSGAWKITTGANVSCVGIGNFT